MKILISIIITLFLTNSYSQLLTENKPEDSKEIIVLAIDKKNDNSLIITPVVILRDKKLITPPQLENGEYTSECKQFITDYFQYEQGYFRVNSGSLEKAVTVYENINVFKRLKKIACSRTVFTRVRLTDKNLSSQLSNCLLTNSTVMANKPGVIKDVAELEQKKIIKEFKKYYQKENVLNKNDSLSILNSLLVSINNKTNIIVSKICITEKDYNINKNFFVIFKTVNNSYQITNYEPLFSRNESEGVWSNRSFDFIDATDVDFDGQNELVFYYTSGESFGYIIYKKFLNTWKSIYSSSDGC